MKCPRCTRALGDDAARGAAYRGAASSDLVCGGCSVVVLEGRPLAARLETTHVQLSRSPLCRDRKEVDRPCGNCGEDRVLRLHLAWDGVADAVIEICEACEAISTESSHAPRLARLLEQAEPMHRSLR